MNFQRLIWKNLNTRIWFLVTSITMTIVFAATMIVTQIPFLRGTLNIVLGGDRAIVAGDRGYYAADYKDKQSVLAAANEFNIKLAEEGITLLKNKDNVLPLASSSKISVFGKNSVNLVYGGSGSGGGNAQASKKTLYESLEGAGFSVNPELKSFYESKSLSGNGRPANPSIGTIIAGFATGETSMSDYPASLTSTGYSGYKDAALVVFSRIGGEGFDLPRTMASSYTSTGTAGAIAGARNADSHYLQLDKNEANLLKHVCDNFQKVIVVLNSNHTMELGFLDDPSYWTDTLELPDQSSKIQAAIWIGSLGNSGIMALGKVLNGTVNPSGRTVDTYARNFAKDPSYQNFGNQSKDNGNCYLTDGTLPNALTNRYYYIDYEEGIYVGYRYYETRGYTDGSLWYSNNVIYPFGYGLSYSDFEWEIGELKLIEKRNDGTEVKTNLTASLSAADLNKFISVDVTVKNKATSSRPGKDVVELFVKVPYYTDGIEKSHVTLADFAKTKLLAPGASEKVTLTFSLYDLASYDYSDANGNGFKGFETEAGEYTLYVSQNAHSWVNGNASFTRNFSVPQIQASAIKGSTGYRYGTDPITGNVVENRFNDVSEKIATYLSRAAWEDTWPQLPTDTERFATQDFIDSLKYVKNDVGQPWEVTGNAPTQSTAELAKEDITVEFIDIVGKHYDDPLWDTLLNQLTIRQMRNLIGNGAYGTVQIENIGKPLTRDPDGPSGFTNFMNDPSVYDTCFYASECVVGSTWNKELAFEMGKMIGNEALIGYEKGDKLPYSGWYAPAINIHRSQFSGRNWEYYSEDSMLSGKMAVQVCLGAKDKGVYTFVKHFAVNDLETCRDSNGLLVWANEQSMREIYFRPFEMTVKDGKTSAMMSSFNRIGKVWAGGDYRLLTEILRVEWGFRGMVVSDYGYSQPYMNIEQMIRAGGDLLLSQGEKFPNITNADATQIWVIRNATKNILYTVANSNAMNAEILGYRLPVWTIALICVNVGLFVGFAVWGFFEIRKAYKKQKSNIK